MPVAALNVTFLAPSGFFSLKAWTGLLYRVQGRSNTQGRGIRGGDYRVGEPDREVGVVVARFVRSVSAAPEERLRFVEEGAR